MPDSSRIRFPPRLPVRQIAPSVAALLPINPICTANIITNCDTRCWSTPTDYGHRLPCDPDDQLLRKATEIATYGFP